MSLVEKRHIKSKSSGWLFGPSHFYAKADLRYDLTKRREIHPD